MGSYMWSRYTSFTQCRCLTSFLQPRQPHVHFMNGRYLHATMRDVTSKWATFRYKGGHEHGWVFINSGLQQLLVSVFALHNVVVFCLRRPQRIFGACYPSAQRYCSKVSHHSSRMQLCSESAFTELAVPSSAKKRSSRQRRTSKPTRLPRTARSVLWPPPSPSTSMLLALVLQSAKETFREFFCTHH